MRHGRSGWYNRRMERDDIVVQLAELAELVKHDGAALELERIDSAAGTIELRLVLDGVECPECVMARDFLESVCLDVLRRAVPEIRSVRISDPREEVTHA